jgi:pyruvate dehydrogenase E2 component (dihydrolipoamide acetyltransferase)
MQEEGFIAKLLFPEGSKDVKLGTVVAIIVDNKDDISKFKDYSGSSSSAPAEAPKKAEAAPVEEKRSCPSSMEKPQSTPDFSAAGGRIFASPIAKKTAQESNVDLSKVQGSGPNNRIIKSDIESAK